MEEYNRRQKFRFKRIAKGDNNTRFFRKIASFWKKGKHSNQSRGYREGSYEVFPKSLDRNKGKDAWMCSWEGSNLNEEKELGDRKEVPEVRDQNSCVQS